MNIEDFRTFCISKPWVTEEFPFDEKTLVFKVGGKLFALTNIDLFESVNLKCNPEKSIEYREQFSAIIPGWHMNKKHWNTVLIDNSLPDSFIYELINHSYELVFNNLPAKIKVQIGPL